MPWVPLLLLAAGLFFTFRSKFIQIRLLGESFRVVSEKPKTKGSISSFGALMISTASRVGTGNIVGVSTAICLVLAYPFSYLISRTFKSKKTLLYMMIIIPFWTNSLVRIYGWRTFLSATGQLNTFLMAIGATSEPIQFLYNQACTVFGMAYDMFPFMVLPLYAAIEKLDESQIEASFDLGANMLTTIFKVVIPQTMSGIFSGCIMVFIPSLGAFYISDILGGGNADVIGNLIQRQFQSANDWPLGAALSILLIAITCLLYTSDAADE